MLQQNNANSNNQNNATTSISSISSDGPNNLRDYLHWVNSVFSFQIRHQWWSNEREALGPLSDRVLKKLTGHFRKQIDLEFQTKSKKSAAAMVALLQKAHEQGLLRRNYFPFRPSMFLKTHNLKNDLDAILILKIDEHSFLFDVKVIPFQVNQKNQTIGQQMNDSFSIHSPSGGVSIKKWKQMSTITMTKMITFRGLFLLFDPTLFQ